MSIAIETNNLAAVAIAGTPPEPDPAQAALVAAAPRTDLPAAASAASAPETATATEQVTPTATEQTAERDPLAALNPADRAVAEKIRDLLATKADRFFASKKERTAVVEFYQNRNLTPIWLENGVQNARAEAVIAKLKTADSDGLDPGEYRPPNFAGLAPDALAEAELKLTHTLLTYARHLQAGRFPYARVSRNIELPQLAPEPADILSNIANATDPGKALDLYSPQNEPYRKLKAMLAVLRGKSVGAKGEASKKIETIEPIAKLLGLPRVADSR
jgi:murein L,D-transpeptidase YcbB/YkuD